MAATVYFKRWLTDTIAWWAQPFIRAEPHVSPLPGWHPLVVHFPLALILVATPLMLAARLLRSETMASITAIVGTWNLCLGALARAVRTGNRLRRAARPGRQRRRSPGDFAAHEMGDVFNAALGACCHLARRRHASRVAAVLDFIIVLLAATAALTVTGYRGAKNVYEFRRGRKRIAGNMTKLHRIPDRVMAVTSADRESCRTSRCCG